MAAGLLTAPCVKSLHRAICEASRPYRALVGEAAWRQLPQAVQRRFDRLLAPGESALYVGEVASTALTKVGWIWAQVARALGAPLPLRALTRTAAAVVVTADCTEHTQLWTRIYHEPGRLPQVVRSMKSFAGSTGLEERVGGGIGMALTVSVQARALVFRSAGYFWRCGRMRVPLPLWLTPGRIEVVHREERTGRFSFTLNVTHPWFGQIVHQVAFFKDAC
jgi:hypothetical protein